MEIKLGGWKALVAIAVIAGFLGFRYLTAVEALDTDGSKAVRDWIAAEYQRYQLARRDLGDADRADLLLKAADVKLVSLAARGRPESMAVRVEIEPNPARPPGSPRVRYFRLEYSLVNGWRHQANISALQYHLTSLW